MSQAVIPLESNPEVFTSFAHKLGLETRFQFHEIYSLTDEELLAFIPRPCPAVIMLFPITQNYEEVFFSEENLKLNLIKEGVSSNPGENSNDGICSKNDVVWFKQTIKNACGLYALLNSMSNLSPEYIKPNSRITEFKKNYSDVNKVSSLVTEVQNEYNEAANAGQTKAPDAEDNITLHFITFVKKDGHLYELDGRRKGAYDLGRVDFENNPDILVEKKLVDRFQAYIDLADDENKLKFSLIALGSSFE